MKSAPYPRPAQAWLTRTQHALFPPAWPSRSQWSWTFTRPRASVWIVSPGGPTTTAVWTPRTIGRGAGVCTRKGTSEGMAVKRLR